MRLRTVSVLSCLASLVLATTASAAITALDLGLQAPPGTLGGFTMMGFSDPRAVPGMVTTVAPPATAPVTGNLTFGVPVEHLMIGAFPLWSTWSHGYVGDVYSTEGFELMMTLPANTMAFYLYVEPNLKFDFEFRIDSEATTTTFSIDGLGGAHGVGFYTDDPTDSLSFVYVKNTDMSADGFAVGEFGINSVAVPEAAAFGTVLGTLALGLGAVYRRQRR